MEDKKVLLEISARHVHVTREVLDVLFGKDYELTKKKDLSQPGQFVSNERIQVTGAKKDFPAVSILGPVRPYTQVELSATDARSIGVTAPVRESGHLEGAGDCTLTGPAGSVVCKESVIVAKRHIHATPADAEKYGLENGQTVKVRVDSDGRSLTFDDVVVRVSDKYSWAMHVDTDEGNAAGIVPSMQGTIIG